MYNLSSWYIPSLYILHVAGPTEKGYGLELLYLFRLKGKVIAISIRRESTDSMINIVMCAIAPARFSLCCKLRGREERVANQHFQHAENVGLQHS